MNKHDKNMSGSIRLAVALVIGLILGMLSYAIISKVGDYSSFIAAVVGALVALLIPIWQTYVVQQSSLALEVNGISRKVSDKAKVSLDEHSELAYLRKMKEGDNPGFFIMGHEPKRPHQDRTVSLDELEELLQRAKQELKDFPEKLADRKADMEKVNAFTAETFTKHECNKLNRPIAPEIDFNAEDVASTLKEFQQSYDERYTNIKDKYDELQSTIPEIERKVGQIRSELIENRSYFEISATLINSGRLNTSIKKPALFRVYIGKENYIDLKLTLSEFETKSEISPNSTVVGSFSSTDISQLPEEDRKLINTYWGQSVQCKLFVEDVHGEPTASNSIAFSEGLYQKIIFDRLAVVATNESM
ncbi:hypothetical protein L1D40_00535 [Shewanella insulae]|uniref:hypothetical protein n=1 Tax=Shewanella insulae TaxID=2681496 RepID=UPI001EFD2585|nr:hypothetical protein [Shewanella insulae]MCG9753707.1 hypothetical protein [Shewanella insulae]